jgi:hypothetical protein
MQWIDQAKMLRRGGMRILQIAEIVGLPPTKVRDALAYKPEAVPEVRGVGYAPAPLPEYPRTPSAKRLAWLHAICAEHGVEWEDVQSHCRKSHLIPARRACCAFLRDVWGMSYPQIGKLMGGRDHTTIIHNVRMGRKQ